MITDQTLMIWYWKGWNDELNGTSTIESLFPLENKAYRIGSAHAIIGDDVRSIDYLTEEEILNIIKNEF